MRSTISYEQRPQDIYQPIVACCSIFGTQQADGFYRSSK